MNKNYGTLEVLCGPMFAGKTTEILKRVLWAKNGEGKKVIVFKPLFDTRYAETEIVSHDGLKSNAVPISSWPGLDDHYDLVVFDEVQFFETPHFSHDLSEIVRDLLISGVNVLAAGLDMDWRGHPFKTTAYLLAMADKVKKLKANCTVSGKPAGKTYKKTKSGGSVELGANNLYEARSNEHWSY